MLSRLDSNQRTTTTFFLYPTVTVGYKKKYRGATVPQITVGVKEKWQPYVGDLSIIISVRYHTHTHPNTKLTRAHVQSTPKERK